MSDTSDSLQEEVDAFERLPAEDFAEVRNIASTSSGFSRKRPNSEVGGSSSGILKKRARSDIKQQPASLNHDAVDISIKRVAHRQEKKFGLLVRP